MDAYTLVKTLHILSATILFGTGLGTAFFFWSARHGDDAARLHAARTTVRADFLFTLPAVVVQPATGAWLIARAGYDPGDVWLVATYILYVLVGLCWLPVVWLQMRMAAMLTAKVAGGAFDAARYERLRRLWFALGWPAFAAVIAIFVLMVAKPAG
jgi:uncharacterized membrane protein